MDLMTSYALNPQIRLINKIHFLRQARIAKYASAKPENKKGGGWLSLPKQNLGTT